MQPLQFSIVMAVGLFKTPNLIKDIWGQELMIKGEDVL